ncbi:hypothetical protein KVR01_007790 [Diaporthe batatas]|uniref:uncharacterized protein n=1 Tax=Diaporthe batatas TaxID=748121 RepID=UPI001D0402C5|nr:uncharacterized protein KVR01_007790 [Diaporthe batatas]KAG8162025.1 hypothetical protein KVR01_007790 [Diaporthe batatas]
MEFIRGFDPEAFAPRMHYKTRNSLGNIVSSYPYHVNVPRFEQWSRALMGVNRESREVFLSFYRITIPTHHLNGDPVGQIYVNPDTDILEMQLEQFTPPVALVAFLHDALANDPAGRGISHLALGRGLANMQRLLYATSLPKSEDGGSAGAQNPFRTHSPSLPLHPVAAAFMREWLQTGLRTFYSVVQPVDGWEGMYPRANGGGRFHLNRSLPFAAQGTLEQATEYSSVGPDPRPVEEGDLASVVVRVDPRADVYSWYCILDNLGVDRSKSVMQIRYLLATWPLKWICNTHGGSQTATSG